MAPSFKSREQQMADERSGLVYAEVIVRNLLTECGKNHVANNDSEGMIRDIMATISGLAQQRNDAQDKLLALMNTNNFYKWYIGVVKNSNRYPLAEECASVAQTLGLPAVPPLP